MKVFEDKNILEKYLAFLWNSLHNCSPSVELERAASEARKTYNTLVTK